LAAVFWRPASFALQFNPLWREAARQAPGSGSFWQIGGEKNSLTEPNRLTESPLIEGSLPMLDVRLPGQSGLELQRELAGAKRQLPIIFITDTVTFQCRCRR